MSVSLSCQIDVKLLRLSQLRLNFLFRTSLISNQQITSISVFANLLLGIAWIQMKTKCQDNMKLQKIFVFCICPWYHDDWNLNLFAWETEELEHSTYQSVQLPISQNRVSIEHIENNNRQKLDLFYLIFNRNNPFNFGT